MSAEVYRMVLCLTCIPSSARLPAEGSWSLLAVTGQSPALQDCTSREENTKLHAEHTREIMVLRISQKHITYNKRSGGKRPLGFGYPH